jgi:phage baseplate assembly protein W
MQYYFYSYVTENMKLKSGLATSSDEDINQVFESILKFAKGKEGTENLTILSFNRI